MCSCCVNAIFLKLQDVMHQQFLLLVQGMPQQGGGGGGVSGSYETHRHKDDLDEKGSYQSN